MNTSTTCHALGGSRKPGRKRSCYSPTRDFKMYNAFADAAENPELPGSQWDHTFGEQNGTTKVSITIFNESSERMESLPDGFTQGIKISLTNLEDLLVTLSQK